MTASALALPDAAHGPARPPHAGAQTVDAAPLAPPVARRPMPPQPWFGLVRGLLFALWPSRGRTAWPSAAPAPWQAAARSRRRVLLALVLGVGALAGWLGAGAGIPTGWPLALVALLCAWVAAGLVTAFMGAWVTLKGDPHAPRADARRPLGRDARTALVMPICNEDIGTVFAGLRATCESLAATGAAELFDVFVLSDTADPALRRAEVAALRALRAHLGDDEGRRIHYRCRRRRREKKAGNVADWCRRWGAAYRYLVVLDADSTMHGDTLVELVRLMEAHPRTGILQTLPQPVGHDTVHARAQQFASQVVGRLFARGMAFWQMGESHYWGHNAILRVEPFMRHCRMGHLPGRGGLSGPILSHDFVEAAMMRRAGWAVWVLPTLGGSWEQPPPNLVDELQRDRRWCQGNLQNARLLAEPGWHPAHRAMFATGAFSYAVAPVWLALVAAGFVAAPAVAGGQAAAAALWGLTASLLLLPRLMGLAAVLLARRQALHGGTPRLVASLLLETLLSALQAPVRMVMHTVFVVTALTGLKLEWRSPPRDARGVAWGEAMARLGVFALPALAAALWLLPDGRAMSWSLLAILLPLLLAVPTAVATGSATLGTLLRRAGLFQVAEEAAVPRVLRRAADQRAFARLQPPAPAARALPRPHAVPAMAVAVLALAAVLPRPAISPEAEILAGARAFGLDLQAAPRLARPAAVARLSAPTRPQRRASERPARFIDDAVRQRAQEAVARATSETG